MSSGYMSPLRSHAATMSYPPSSCALRSGLPANAFSSQRLPHIPHSAGHLRSRSVMQLDPLLDEILPSAQGSLAFTLGLWQRRFHAESFSGLLCAQSAQSAGNGFLVMSVLQSINIKLMVTLRAYDLTTLQRVPFVSEHRIGYGVVVIVFSAVERPVAHRAFNVQRPRKYRYRL